LGLPTFDAPNRGALLPNTALHCTTRQIPPGAELYGHYTMSIQPRTVRSNIYHLDSIFTHTNYSNIWL